MVLEFAGISMPLDTGCFVINVWRKVCAAHKFEVAPLQFHYQSYLKSRRPAIRELLSLGPRKARISALGLSLVYPRHDNSGSAQFGSGSVQTHYPQFDEVAFCSLNLYVVHHLLHIWI